jgi:hypothetical protein
VSELYDEARACMSVRAYTSVALACRKLLMNTAVTKGAKENQSFTTYVDYLFNKGFIATHEIPQIIEADASELIAMTETLLRLVYELPALMNARVMSSAPPPPSP